MAQLPLSGAAASAPAGSLVPVSAGNSETGNSEKANAQAAAELQRTTNNKTRHTPGVLALVAAGFHHQSTKP
jgi:hypothetical protein